MQIKGLHKNIYKLSAYSLSQQKCELLLQKWRNSRLQAMPMHSVRRLSVSAALPIAVMKPF